MIAVKIYWNTNDHGEFFTELTDVGELPCSFYGPFDTIEEANYWMVNDYPENDPDVHDMVAAEFLLPDDLLKHVVDPKSIYDEPRDEDIRPESREIQGP